jgi:hypothetical protein
MTRYDCVYWADSDLYLLRLRGLMRGPPGKSTAIPNITHSKTDLRRSARNTEKRYHRRNAREGIRTLEHLRDKALNLAPLTWLGNPRPLPYREGSLHFLIYRSTGAQRPRLQGTSPGKHGEDGYPALQAQQSRPEKSLSPSADDSAGYVGKNHAGICGFPGPGPGRQVSP